MQFTQRWKEITNLSWFTHPHVFPKLLTNFTQLYCTWKTVHCAHFFQNPPPQKKNIYVYKKNIDRRQFSVLFTWSFRNHSNMLIIFQIIIFLLHLWSNKCSLGNNNLQFNIITYYNANLKIWIISNFWLFLTKKCISVLLDLSAVNDLYCQITLNLYCKFNLYTGY